MFARSTILAAAAFTGLVSAQGVSNDSIPATCPGYSQSGGNLTFPADCIPNYYRETWCNAEQDTCRTVCGADNVSPTNNVCYSSSLTYRCVCDSGYTPNISDYQQSLPAYMCYQWVGFCTAAHPDDLQGQDNCQSITCGNKSAALDPNAGSGSSSGSSTSSSSSSSPSETASSTSSSGSGSSDATGTPSSSSTGSTASSTGNAAAALRVGSEYGVAIIGGGLLALFGFAL
ncbi:hypothetical protein K431DRAFT_343018 [Polychaeton citri CBS 116435]|uniref:DUF7707 domain-containing protein n=1 Tax=Polychaeton citri CBS 116435 TaxID=1314669 RepID=A0A9P4QIN4_9PEZI|nr:hypothetical protein K431DRAFT_343018 [Polychaeton citri CBS 116435]